MKILYIDDQGTDSLKLDLETLLSNKIGQFDL